MLRALDVRDLVLIERLTLELAPGLCVLTGETGAGKSILLDALGLACGARGEPGVVRAGAPQATVTAEFDLPPGHPARAVLAEHGIEEEDVLLLRRTVSADGRGRAFVNDQVASVGLLRRLGDTLLEVHGQHDGRGLLNPAAHRGLLDTFGGLAGLRAEVRAAHAAWAAAAAAVAAADAALAAARDEEAFMRHALEELEALAPEPGEEATLAEERAMLQQAERIAAALAEAEQAFAGAGGIDHRLGQAEKALARAAPLAGGRLDDALAALDRAVVEVAEASAALNRAARDLDLDPRRLERQEERLFALRDMARKHRVGVEALAGLRDDFARRLALIDDGADRLGRLAAEAAATRRAFAARVAALSAARREAATRLDAAVQRELAPLRLDRAIFRTTFADLPEADWGADGGERVAFEVATNPGSAPGSIARIASGGELSRFMLALKVSLAERGSATTLVFDEVDAGIGGAVADKVGERLARLGRAAQVLVVTHSPQVAARGGRHWRVAKHERAGTVRVEVDALDDAARREEIARMLAGAEITRAAREAADSLLAAGRA